MSWSPRYPVAPPLASTKQVLRLHRPLSARPAPQKPHMDIFPTTTSATARSTSSRAGRVNTTTSTTPSSTPPTMNRVASPRSQSQASSSVSRPTSAAVTGRRATASAAGHASTNMETVVLSSATSGPGPRPPSRPSTAGKESQGRANPATTTTTTTTTAAGSVTGETAGGGADQEGISPRRRERAPVYNARPALKYERKPTVVPVDGKHLHESIEGWLRQSGFDSFLKYRPLRYDISFNESLRSVDQQCHQERSQQSYNARVVTNAMVELHTQKRRTPFHVAELSGVEANRFLLLQERFKSKGFPIPRQLRQVTHNATLSEHPFAVVFGAPRMPGVRCMIVGRLQHTRQRRVKASVHLPTTLTTMTEKLQAREARTRTDVNPAASLRLLQRMKAKEASVAASIQNTDDDEDLQEALATVVKAVIDTEEEADEEEELRLRKVLQYTLGGSNHRLRKQLPFELQQTMIQKATAEAQALRKPISPAVLSARGKSSDVLAHYDDCNVLPQYVVIYRSSVMSHDQADFPVQSIIHRRHEGAASAAAAIRDPSLSLLEVTMQWHCPIVCLRDSLNDSVLKNRVCLNIDDLSPDIQSKAIPLPLFLRTFGNGVVSIDVMRPLKRPGHTTTTSSRSNSTSPSPPPPTGVLGGEEDECIIAAGKDEVESIVEFRHSFVFSNR